MRAWIITKDYLSREPGTDYPTDPGSPTDVGTVGPRDAPDDLIAKLKKGKGYAFVMKDDDGEIYYRGRNIWTDDEDLETGCYGPLGDFGDPNAGCTSITYPGHREYDCG